MQQRSAGLHQIFGRDLRHVAALGQIQVQALHRFFAQQCGIKNHLRVFQGIPGAGPGFFQRFSFVIQHQRRAAAQPVNPVQPTLQDQRPQRLFTCGLGLLKTGNSFMAFQPLQVAIAQLRPTRPKGQELGIAQTLLLGHGLGQDVKLGAALRQG